jgi:hypothetical protein
MPFPRIVVAVFLTSASLWAFLPSRIWAHADGADPLEPLAWAAGSTWAADIKTNDGSLLRIEATFRRSGHKKTITYDVVFKTNEKSYSQYEGTYFWHPGKKAITLVEVDAQGNTTEGVLTPEGTMLVQHNNHTQADGTVQEQRVEIVRKGDDAFAFEAFVKKEGEWARAVGFTYNRVKGLEKTEKDRVGTTLP